MLFPTIEFALFFIAVFICSWSLTDYPKARKVFLTAASYFFYGFWDWRFTFLLFAYTLVNYLFALAIGKANKDYEKKYNLIEPQKSPRSKIYITIALLCNIGALVFFKYYFFAEVNLNNLFTAVHAPFHIPALNIALPIGISFFTFQAMSYIIDVYRMEYPPYRSLLDVMMYKAFFPQLVAGPIVRAKEFLPQLKRVPTFADVQAGKAILLISGGLFKKVLIANYIATLYVDNVFSNPAAYSSLEVLMGVYGYAVQIYCDFSAYSDIAIGVALLLGYRFPINFASPYRSVSIQDFWRRWHISLSSWLRDYLYISLGGNRRGKLKTYRNLIITMLLGGLWHGAAWNFIIWGALHGTGLAVERFINELLGRSKNYDKEKHPLRRALGIVFTFNFVCLGWIFFRASSFTIAVAMIKKIFAFSFSVQLLSPFILFLIALGIAIHFIPQKWDDRLTKAADSLPIVLLAFIFAAVLFLISAVSPEGVAPFIYFQF